MHTVAWASTGRPSWRAGKKRILRVASSALSFNAALNPWRTPRTSRAPLKRNSTSTRTSPCKRRSIDCAGYRGRGFETILTGVLSGSRPSLSGVVAPPVPACKGPASEPRSAGESDLTPAVGNAIANPGTLRDSIHSSAGASPTEAPPAAASGKPASLTLGAATRRAAPSPSCGVCVVAGSAAGEPRAGIRGAESSGALGAGPGDASLNVELAPAGGEPDGPASLLMFWFLNKGEPSPGLPGSGTLGGTAGAESERLAACGETGPGCFAAGSGGGSQSPAGAVPAAACDAFNARSRNSTVAAPRRPGQLVSSMVSAAFASDCWRPQRRPLRSTTGSTKVAERGRSSRIAVGATVLDIAAGHGRG